MKAFFRGLAAAFKAEAPAQAIAGVLILALALYTVGLFPSRRRVTPTDTGTLFCLLGLHYPQDFYDRWICIDLVSINACL
jgi:hypothetical protein